MFLDNVKFITEDNLETNHMMIRHQNPIGLFVMLPGGNNASDRPIMHYMRKVMLDEGYDVLNINYEGLLGKQNDIDFYCNKILNITKEILLKRLDDYKGLKVSMFSRSLGSLIGAKLAKYPFVSFHKIVIISPTSPTVEALNGVRCKVYLDPKDTHVSVDAYNTLIHMDDIECKEYENVGHNFEVDYDIEKTIDTLKDVVLDMKKYLIG